MFEPTANLDNIVHTELYSLLAPIVIQNVPKTTISLSTSPKGLTELTENCALTVMEYCMEMNQEKKHTQQHPEKV